MFSPFPDLANQGLEAMSDITYVCDFLAEQNDINHWNNLHGSPEVEGIPVFNIIAPEANTVPSFQLPGDDEAESRCSNEISGNSPNKPCFKGFPTLKELQESNLIYENLQTVCNELGIGITRFKKYLRSVGLHRWPSRHLVSMKKLREQVKVRMH